MNDNDMQSRTRPGRQPDPNVAALRAIRAATRDYLIVLDAALAALTNDAIADNPDLAYLRSAIAIAAGARGAGYGFGSAANIERLLSKALGEETT
jgi:hypothetical protein